MRKVVTLSLVVGVLACGPSARAENFGIWFGSQSPYCYADRDGDGWEIRAVCLGELARRFEGRLRHEEAEGDPDPWIADGMHVAINRLEDRSRDQCEEGGRRSISKIALQYDRIQGWIDTELHVGSRSD